MTHYVIRNVNGSTSDLVPFGYEFDPEALETGSHFVKQGAGFSADVNGKRELWPYLWQHVLVSLLGACGLLLWYFCGGVKVLAWWLRERKA